MASDEKFVEIIRANKPALIQDIPVDEVVEHLMIKGLLSAKMGDMILQAHKPAKKLLRVVCNNPSRFRLALPTILSRTTKPGLKSIFIGNGDDVQDSEIDYFACIKQHFPLAIVMEELKQKGQLVGIPHQDYERYKNEYIYDRGVRERKTVDFLQYILHDKRGRQLLPSIIEILNNTDYQDLAGMLPKLFPLRERK